jgi:hypothetical protein
MKYRVIFFPIILAALFWYTHYKLNQFAPQRKSTGIIASSTIFFFMLAWQFAYRLPHISIDSFLFKALAWTGSISMGIWATFLIYALPIDIFQFVFFGINKFFNPPAFDPFKRELLSTGIPMGLLGLAGGSSVFGFLEASSSPKIKEVNVPIENLPSELNGLKIAQISDLHIGPTIRRDYVADVVKKVLETNPDLIAITGDLIDGTPHRLMEHTEPLSRLSAPLGTYYVTGNHEYYWGADAWIQASTGFGFIPLINENRILEFRGKKILIAGVTDISSHEFIVNHRSDPKRAAIGSEGCPLRILLAHRPDSYKEAEPAGFQLQISGHTHAGQFFPWNFLVRLAHKYYRGLNRHGKMWVYVNAGTGYWGPAHRFLVPSEITLIRLKSNS